jgi:hypothetical protein
VLVDDVSDELPISDACERTYRFDPDNITPGFNIVSEFSIFGYVQYRENNGTVAY